MAPSGQSPSGSMLSGLGTGYFPEIMINASCEISTLFRKPAFIQRPFADSYSTQALLKVKYMCCITSWLPIDTQTLHSFAKIFPGTMIQCKCICVLSINSCWLLHRKLKRFYSEVLASVAFSCIFILFYLPRGKLELILIKKKLPFHINPLSLSHTFFLTWQ